VPLGQTKGKWNYNLDEKRVLNFENVVNDDDNIKQDLSIDVYGRKSEEDADAAPEAAPAAAPAAVEARAPSTPQRVREASWLQADDNRQLSIVTASSAYDHLDRSSSDTSGKRHSRKSLPVR